MSLMKGSVRGVFFILMASLFLTGCKRKEGTQIEPGTAAGESEDVGYLALQITTVYEKQKPLDQSPWHADGGDWTFFDCRLAKDTSTAITVGTFTKSSEKSDDTSGIPISWGGACLAVSDTAAGARFVDAFAKAFHTENPAVRTNHPTWLLKCTTAIIGTELKPAAGGGFGGSGRGTWTATKWFVQDEPIETEVFFNFSASEKRAAFSEKDPDYRENLVQQFAVALRDGPLPERTPENDPTLARIGPTVVNWTQIGGSNETCQFSPDSATLAITTGEIGAHSRVFIAPVAQITNRTLLGDFEGSTSIEQFLSLSNGLTLFVAEILHENPHMYSSADPQRFWLLDTHGKYPIKLPAEGTNWIAWKSPVSGDGAFIALSSWEKGANKKRDRVLHLGNLRSGEWRTIQLPGETLELAGWDGGRGIVLTGMDFDTKTVRKSYSLDPATAKLSSLDSIPAKFNPALQLSPDGKHSVEIMEKDRLIISDLATGQKRDFVFQPVDKPNAYRDSVHWVNDRYLIFESERTALIDSQALKMSFLAGAKEDFNSAEFSPDFKWAIGIKAGLHYLGTVKLPE